MKKIVVLSLVLLSVMALQLFEAQNSLASPSAEITVTTTADELNDDGDCSLREAIQAANLNAVVDQCAQGNLGKDTIHLPAGEYTLTRSGADDTGEFGDLDILESVQITGAGASNTLVSGNQIDRVFHVVPMAPSKVEVTIEHVTIKNGKVQTEGAGGAGVLVAGSLNSLTLQNCVIRENQATYPNGTNATVGGGLDNWLAKMVITNCAIVSNTADRGGGIYTDGNTLIQQSLISENNARDDGGGIDSGGAGSTTLVNVTLSRNGAPSGAGIFNDSTISLTNATILFNGATESSAGFANNLTASIKNSLVAFNGVDGDTNCGGGGTFNSLGHNLENNTTCNFTATGDLESIDPLIDENLQDNGGATFTHALFSGSPAIDAGDNAGCPAVDQRGAPRPLDGDQDGVSVCDIGAYEAPQLIYLPLIFR